MWNKNGRNKPMYYDKFWYWKTKNHTHQTSKGYYMGDQPKKEVISYGST